MKKKALIMLSIVLTLMMVLIACAKTETQAPAPAAAADAPAAPAAEKPSEAKAPIVLMVGYENNPGEPVDLAMNRWKELVAERGDGSIVIELYPSSQLGSKNEVIDQMVAGDPVATLCDGSFYADRGVPDFGIPLGPYMFKSWDEVWKLVESDWWQQQVDKLAEVGNIQIFSSNWIYGTRHTMTTMPVKSVEDLAGKKIRVANSTLYVKMYEALGAVPTPMALGDVYVALQQGTIDGLENPLSTLYNGKFQEVAKYLILDGHVYNSTTWICGTTFWNSLTDAQREFLSSTCDEAGLYNNEICMDIDEEMLQKLIDEGVTIVKPTEEVIKGFQEKAKTFYSDPEATKGWTPGLYETVRAIIDG